MDIVETPNRIEFRKVREFYMTKMKASAILFAGAVAASSAAAVDRETDPDRPRQGRTRKRVSSRDSSASQIDIGATSDGARRSTLTLRGIQGNSRLFNPLDRNLREQRKGRGQKTNHNDEPPLGRHKRSSAKKPINKRSSAKSDKPDTRSKSGKSGKSESYHIAPFSCPGQCIDAEGADYETGELSSAVQACNVHGSHGYTQQWLIHQDTTFVKAESYAYEGQCIGVVYEPGDSAEDIKGACEYAELALRPCDSLSTNWYFTGGQLLSAFCWLNGVSSIMGVYYLSETVGCAGDLSSYSGNIDPLQREDTFLFIESDVMAMMEVSSRSIEDVPENFPTTFPTYFPSLSPTISPMKDPEE